MLQSLDKVIYILSPLVSCPLAPQPALVMLPHSPPCWKGKDIKNLLLQNPLTILRPYLLQHLNNIQLSCLSVSLTFLFHLHSIMPASLPSYSSWHAYHIASPLTHNSLYTLTLMSWAVSTLTLNNVLRTLKFIFPSQTCWTTGSFVQLHDWHLYPAVSKVRQI